MTKLTMQATEMKAAKVERISLVARGANRIPIRIVKEDSTMKSPFGELDLARVFTRKSEAPAPVVTGIVTMKGEGFEGVKSAIAEAGFVVEKAAEAVEGETTVVSFAQGDEPVAETDTVIKMSPDVALVVKGFRPYQVDMAVGDATFGEACAAQGFYPGVSTMVDVLRSSVYDTVSKADSPADAVVAIKKMFTEVESYVVGLVGALPTKAFKLEGVVAEPVEAKKEEPKAEEPKVEDKTEAAADADKTPAEPVVKNEGDEKPADAAKPAVPAVAETPAVPALKSEDVSKMLDAAFAKMGEQIASAVSGVQKSVEGVNESITGLTQRVESVEGVAKAAKEAVEGTVLGSDADDHVTEKTQKSDNGGRAGRDIDTAFAPRRRPGAR